MAARSSERRDGTTLIGACSQAVDDGKLNDIEAFAILCLLIAAGGESTTSLTGTGVRILAERLDLQDRLRRQPGLIPAFVGEACRIDPPFRGALPASACRHQARRCRCAGRVDPDAGMDGGQP